MSYRPITDVMMLARSKVKYYGAYPAGFLQRARDLLGVGTEDAVLHVCAGHVLQYPFAGLGPNDRTLDLDPNTHPDFVHDAREPYPLRAVPGESEPVLWSAVLADPPYTAEDAAHYAVGADVLPSARVILMRSLDAVRIGGKVGVLHYMAPRPPKDRARFVGLYLVFIGFENRCRILSIYERKI